ncbi:hypothetical protein AB7459_12915 [Providencia rettgeri]|uniref:hypothetical protein n=1 Tax=Providencia sp. PROV269 TaxID=2949957 RepID=UPI00234A8B2B|nr:hypothetical protein [Providencia sp. PROV269]ELR5297352.1 hypothetical protein [Providencia rettgeri]MCL0017392.1 hypothetical protein [Providencia rettgeri]
MNNTLNTALVLFVYNREFHTKKTLAALANNKNIHNTTLYIFCDAAKKNEDNESVNRVRDSVIDFKWPGYSKKIIFRDKNMGLGPSVIDGISLVMEEHNAVIVIEDDIITNESFFDYMLTMLELYKKTPSVYSISGYVIPPLSTRKVEDIYFIPRISSWGWGTWKDRWMTVDWSISDYTSFINNKHETHEFKKAGNDMLDMLINQVEGESESWAIRFDYNRYKNNGLTIYPGSSLVSNIGSDGSGSHRDNTTKFDVPINGNFFSGETFSYRVPTISNDATLTYQKFYSSNFISKIIIVLRRLGLYDVCIPLLKRIRDLIK